MARRLPARRRRLLLLLLQPLLLLLLPASSAAHDHADRGRLGAPCRASGRCDVQHSHCVEGQCDCFDHLVVSASGRRCLPVAPLLGDRCDEDAQCAVEHSACRRASRACECRRGFVAAGGARCLAEATLGGVCQHPAQCVGLTECSAPGAGAGGPAGVCVCKGIAFEAQGRCVTDDDPSRDWGPPQAPAAARAAALPPGGIAALLTFAGLANVLLKFSSQQFR